MPTNFISNEALKLDSNLLKKFMYQLDMEFVGEESPQIPQRSIIGFRIDSDFRNNIQPLFTVQLSLSSKRYNILATKKSELEIKMKLSKFPVDLEYGESGIAEQIKEKGLTYTTVWESIFQPFVDHLNPLIGVDIFTDSDKEMDPLNDDNIDNQTANFSLFNRNIMNSTKALSNAIIRDAKVADAIGVILKKSNIKKLIICPPENTKTYEQIIIPPANLVNNLEYLQKVFGIYDTGMRKFITADNTLYLLSNNINVLPVKSNDYNTVEILIPSPDDSRGYQQSCCKDDENKVYHIVYSANSINEFSDASVNKEIRGSKLNFSNPKDVKYGTTYDDSGSFTFGSGNQIIAPKTNADVAGDDKVAFLKNDLDNPMFENEIQYAMEESNSIIEMEFNNIDIDIFTMNRKFKLIFEETQYQRLNGFYKLDTAISTFIRNSDTISMKCTILARFRRWEEFKSNNTRG